MLKKFFDFKRAKTLPESVVFYGVMVAVYLILAHGAAAFLNAGL